MPIGGFRAAAINGDLSLCAGLRLHVMNRLKNMVTLLILITVAGCSFHSAQWESAKALWAMRATATQQENETYWWDMEHEEISYRLFPVAWDGKTVLTDASRWMVVLHNGEIMMIRDFKKNQQITFEDSVGAIIEADEMSGNSGSSGHYPNSSYPGASTEVLIIKSSISNPTEVAKITILCLPSRLDSQSMRLITRCTSGEQQTDFRMAEFDQSGNILSLRLNLLSNKTWAIYRSDDLVDAFEIKRYLDGDVDEI